MQEDLPCSAESGFASFAQCVETACRLADIEPDHTLALVAGRRALQEQIGAHLRSKGVNRLKTIGLGSRASVFESDDGRIVRITPTLRPRPKYPAILQAYSERVIADGTARIKLEILPKLRTDNVTKEDCTTIVDALVAAGFCVNDVFRRNIGRLPDGTPLLLDPDDEYPPKVMPTFGSALNSFKTRDGRLWKQHEAFPDLSGSDRFSR